MQQCLAVRCGAMALAAMIAVACPAAITAAAADAVCHEQETQFANIKRCVSSVSPARDGKTYGPEKLTGTGEGAWCAGARIGDTVTLHQKPKHKLGAFFLVNGYADTPDVFLANGRVKKVRMETSGGAKRTLTIKDTPKEQMFRFKPEALAWLRLTILDVYPGKAHSSPCVSMIYFNHESAGLN